MSASRLASQHNDRVSVFVRRVARARGRADWHALTLVERDLEGSDNHGISAIALRVLRHHVELAYYAVAEKLAAPKLKRKAKRR